MLLLGIDLGTSSIKVSVLDAATQQCIASAVYPDNETEIISLQHDWAEQNPDQWWENIKQAIVKCHQYGNYNPAEIGSIGLAYQMHGLVLVDKNQQVLRNSIIWCDSRAVETGKKAFREIGETTCLSHFLNAPGNFTASKLAWVKENEPAIYEKIDKVLLPGDFVAMKFTGETTTTIPALSEGIFWDFREHQLAEILLVHYGFEKSFFPDIQETCSIHGNIKTDVAVSLGLKAGIPVAYKAGDQPNNAFALNVLQPGEVAVTAGTSGVVYGITDKMSYDPASRINSFAHVNHSEERKRIGVLLCINGAGIFNRWIKNILGANYSYTELNEKANQVPAGANGLLAFPFGNGAERMLHNTMPGAQFANLNFNIHSDAHLVRAVQEGVAFAFRYGLDIMAENGMQPTLVRAAKANLFLSGVFAQSFANVNNLSIEFYEGDGSYGAALGAGVGAGFYSNYHAAVYNRKPNGMLEPADTAPYEDLYQQWKQQLNKQIETINQINGQTISVTS
jgi:xylulokinase